ncbi:hypothetical protein [Arthrobacter alpinus]|uniref:hypothetical protein n=1 Tax=Arthrobacter alpinus TaxID=656366 RepID=UPI0012FF3D0A|nr:hypothetical protein [Arthrobacter alpinus]
MAIIALLAVPLVGLGTSVPAAADGMSCTQDEAIQGICITAVALTGQDPLVEGVQQRIDRGGDLTGLERFIEARSIVSKNDSTQQALDEKLAKAKSKNKDLTETKRGDSFSALNIMNSNGVGSVRGPSLWVEDVATYFYCGPDGCDRVGSVKIEFVMTINGNLDFSLSGSLKSDGLSEIRFQEIECLTYHDGLFNIDTVVKNWTNCTDAEDPDWRSQTLILGKSWSGGPWGETYHPQYNIEFVAYYSNPEPFSFGWTGKEYKIPVDSAHGYTNWID